MAIINVTPDSFSDGGETLTVESALDRMRRAVEAGADLIDIGGESTRPGAARIPAREQLNRIIPVIRAAHASGISVPISVDTTLAAVAEEAINAGASIINDVSAGTEDAGMLPLAASCGAGVILMHRLRPPGEDVYSTQYAAPPDYGEPGVVEAVVRYLSERAAAAVRAGVSREAIVLDPGLGFGKSVEQNWELIRRIGEIQLLGFPALSAASRKSFLSSAPGGDQPKDRIAMSVGVTIAHALMGIRLFRVHDPEAHLEALRAMKMRQ